MFLAMVNHDAYTSRRAFSPLNFAHYDVEYLGLCWDGRQLPSKAFLPQFNQVMYVTVL